MIWFVHSTYILKHRSITLYKHMTEQILTFSTRPKLEDSSALGPSLRYLLIYRKGKPHEDTAVLSAGISVVQ